MGGTADKFYGADGLVQQQASDGSIIMVDTTTGAYQESDGTWYTEDGNAMSYYNPNDGSYVEEGDPSSTLYDANGNPVNPSSASGQTAAAAGAGTPKSSPSIWSSILGAVSGIAGTKTATTTGGTIQPVYKPTVSTSNTGGLIVAVLVIGAVITVSVIIIRKKAPAAPAAAPAA